MPARFTRAPIHASRASYFLPWPKHPESIHFDDQVTFLEITNPRTQQSNRWRTHQRPEEKLHDLRFLEMQPSVAGTVRQSPHSY